MADEPHPTAQAVIEEVQTTPVPPSDGLSPESARDRLERIMGSLPVEDVASVHDYAIPGLDSTAPDVPVRIYEPDATPPYPILVYFHGGGFAAGSLDTHDNVCAALTNRADCLTVSVDYRLAPENPFPAAVEDAFAVLQWVEGFAHRINGDAERIAVASDSAGGNLAAASTLVARDQGGPDLVHQGLVYPGLGSPLLHSFESYDENAEGYFLTMDTVEYYYDTYVQSPAHVRNSYATPLLATDLAGVPPATVVTAGFDPVRDEGVAYAEKLAADGIPVEHDHYEEMIHAFVSMPHAVPQGQDALDELGADLTDAFAG